MLENSIKMTSTFRLTERVMLCGGAETIVNVLSPLN